MLSAQDHTKHPIVRRQVDTLLKAGYTLTVIDQADTQRTATVSYRWLRVRPITLNLFSKGVWFFLRRLHSEKIGEAWWTYIYVLRLVLTSIRYALLAFREHADVYHAHDLDPLLPALVAGKLRRRPVIYDAHELQSEQGHPGQMIKAVFRFMERRLIPLADHFVVPNASRAKLYVERYGLKREPTIILNCPPSVPISRTNTLREALKLPDSTRIVLYHGTYMAGRALEELLLAAKSFDDNIALVMMGEQNEYFKQALYPLYQKERLASRVFFLPFVSPDQVMRYVASADLGVVIYKNVNLNNYLCAPTKLYEYFMAQLPVVACDFPEMRNVLAEYPVGSTFDPASPTSLAQAVNEFFATQHARAPEIAHHLSLARQLFTWEAECQKLLSLYGAVPSSVPTTTRNEPMLVQSR